MSNKLAYNKAYYLENKQIFKAKNAEYYSNNKEVLLDYGKRYYEKNKEIVRARERERYRAKDIVNRRKGITAEIFEQLLSFQNYKCAICLVSLDLADAKNVHRDHSHVTKRVRGILCTPCNTLLGKLEKRGFQIQPFIDYIASPPADKVIK